jgi:4-carboxymuconolactone decarboxylase
MTTRKGHHCQHRGTHRPRLASVRTSACLLWAVAALGIPSIAQDRMPEIPASHWTDGQKKAVEAFVKSRGKPPGHTAKAPGPFVPLLRSPELMMPAEALVSYLQFKTVLPPKLREFVILITARQWMQHTEWNSHLEIALKAGVGLDVIKALAAGERPSGMSDDEAAVYDFCDELHRNQSVSDATYARALSRFGEQGIIDLVGVNGGYTFLAIVMNTARTPPPPLPDSLPALAAFPR